MEYIQAWLVTVLFSAVLNFTNELRLYKYLADNGYKINYKTVFGFDKAKAIEKSLEAICIPIINIVTSTAQVITHDMNREELFETLKANGCLDEMTPEEKRAYKKLPLGINALAIKLKEARKLSKLPNITITTKSGISQVFFKVTPEGEIEIIKTYGELENASEYEIKSRVAEVIKAHETYYGPLKTDKTNVKKVPSEDTQVAPIQEHAGLPRKDNTRKLIR